MEKKNETQCSGPGAKLQYMNEYATKKAYNISI